MSDNLKIQLISAAQTFVSVFLITAGTLLTTTNAEFSGAFVISIISAAATAAVRATIKLIASKFISVNLGGNKQ